MSGVATLALLAGIVAINLVGLLFATRLSRRLAPVVARWWFGGEQS
jgi:hypothetical protein